MNAFVQSARRVWGLMYRHFCLYRKSWPRLLELGYWPTLELLIWGFTARFLSNQHPGHVLAVGAALIGGVLLWEVALRAQIGVTLSFLEEIWSRNLGHVFVSPLRPYELILGLLGVSVVRALIGLAPATMLASLLYHFNVFTIGPGGVARCVEILGDVISG